MEYYKSQLKIDYDLNAILIPYAGECDLNFGLLEKDNPKEIFAFLKVMHEGCSIKYVEMQIEALNVINKECKDCKVPHVFRNKEDRFYTIWSDRIVYVISALSGMTLADFRPHTPDLMKDIGISLGSITKVLKDHQFDHDGLNDKDQKWHPLNPHWAFRNENINLLKDETEDSEKLFQICQESLEYFIKHCEKQLVNMEETPIHCDANDYNIIVKTLDVKKGPELSGIIDFGDMCQAPVVCDVSTAAAYLVLGFRPNMESSIESLVSFVKGYNESWPLTDDELALIFPLLCTRLAVSLVNSAMMKREKPNDPYVTISAKPARNFLLSKAQKWSKASVEQRLRVALGRPVVPNAVKVYEWLLYQDKQCSIGGLFGDIEVMRNAPICSIAVGDSTLPTDPTNLTPEEALKLVPDTLTPSSSNLSPMSVGGYLEPRLIYTEDFFLTGEENICHEQGKVRKTHPVEGRRTIHLGVDVFVTAGRSVYAPLEGEVVYAAVRPDRLDYGGTIILKHTITLSSTEIGTFFTLYGHLNPNSIIHLSRGMIVSKDELLAEVGDSSENGGWQPHLHFQLCLALPGYDDERDYDWPGVADADDIQYFSAVYANPAPLMCLPQSKVLYPITSTEELLEYRQKYFSGNLKMSYYPRSIQLLRGWRTYMYDEYGRAYLDAYNNVPHVGHAHPRLQKIAEKQFSLINTNTRYLHKSQIEFSKELRKKLPDSLTHCYFVTSGSEANELALRLARAYTGRQGMIVQENGYHGHTTGTIDISPYKFTGPGGSGCADWVEVVPAPDCYRGEYGYEDINAGSKYSAAVVQAIERLSLKGNPMAGFIAETYPSVAGQIIPPKDYLPQVYEKIHSSGGVCIADEVQTGLGRCGKYYWGFEDSKVVPDIVVIGKPCGNGYPIGVVVTTKTIADSFTNGMEFFSTFGGSTVACLMGTEVMRIVADEDLQRNAFNTGNHLLKGFNRLMNAYTFVGDVRGVGLFLGIELVIDRKSKEPATKMAKYVADRLRDCRILIGTDGPYDNVLKIRPPLTISIADCDLLLDRLEKIFDEVKCSI